MKLAEVLDILEVECLDTDLYCGQQADTARSRIFGGQVLAQALWAASESLPEGRLPHSLHAYFFRPGDPQRPIIFSVTRLRDGGSFSTRRVSAIQQQLLPYSDEDGGWWVRPRPYDMRYVGAPPRAALDRTEDVAYLSDLTLLSPPQGRHAAVSVPVIFTGRTGSSCAR